MINLMPVVLSKVTADLTAESVLLTRVTMARMEVPGLKVLEELNRVITDPMEVTGEVNRITMDTMKVLVVLTLATAALMELRGTLNKVTPVLKEKSMMLARGIADLRWAPPEVSRVTMGLMETQVTGALMEVQG